MTGSLASVHPELIPEWSEKNLPLTPDKITFGSNKRVWWKGACGHEWETSVKARSKGEKCPICSGARVIEGINDLATLKPLLAQEWSRTDLLCSIRENSISGVYFHMPSPLCRMSGTQMWCRLFCEPDTGERSTMLVCIGRSKRFFFYVPESDEHFAHSFYIPDQTRS